MAGGRFTGSGKQRQACIFVQPLALKPRISEVWQEGHVGEQSDDLHPLLQKYDNRIFFFTGHLHMGIFEDGYGVAEEGNITYINIPSFGSENTDGDADVQNTGMGLQTEVYADEVVVRVRNFAAHEWTKYEYKFTY